MHTAPLLLATLQPAPDAAPWQCFHAINREQSYFSVSRYLTPEGRPAGDFVLWSAGGASSLLGAAVWRIQERPVWNLRIEALTFAFTLPRAPASPLRLRVEADGRVIARIPVSPPTRQIGPSRLGTFVRLTRSPDPDFPAHGAVPEIGSPQTLTGTLEERGGHVLATVSFPLPEAGVLRVEAQQSLRRAIEKAADYRSVCMDRRQPLPVPAMPRPRPRN
jgi:hypothetical protein